MPSHTPFAPAPFSAVILAAGFSFRMGRDKALLRMPEGGEPLWSRQRRLLVEAGAAEIFLSARPSQAWAEPAGAEFAAVVRDAAEGAGPLGGIAAALQRASHPQLAVLAVDLPHMTAAFLAKLRARGATGAVPAWPDGRLEPLCAFYPREALPLAQRAVQEQRLAVRDWIDEMGRQDLVTRVPIAPEEAPLFLNWNEPRDLPAH